MNKQQLDNIPNSLQAASNISESHLFSARMSSWCWLDSLITVLPRVVLLLGVTEAPLAGGSDGDDDGGIDIPRDGSGDSVVLLEE